MNKFDLEERLINYSVHIIKITNILPDTRTGKHLAGQLIRSGTSPALNYGEAQAAESRKDFIHKVKVVLKELRESLVCLKIIDKAELLKSNELINILLKESEELISIFVKSVKTAEVNLRQTKQIQSEVNIR